MYDFWWNAKVFIMSKKHLDKVKRQPVWAEIFAPCLKMFIEQVRFEHYSV